MYRVRRGTTQVSEGDDVKRSFVTILIFLLAGAVVNVGVAWGCAAWLDVFRGQHQRVTDRNTDLGVFRAAKFSRP